MSSIGRSIPDDGSGPSQPCSGSLALARQGLPPEEILRVLSCLTLLESSEYFRVRRTSALLDATERSERSRVLDRAHAVKGREGYVEAGYFVQCRSCADGRGWRLE